MLPRRPQPPSYHLSCHGSRQNVADLMFESGSKERGGFESTWWNARLGKEKMHIFRSGITRPTSKIWPVTTHESPFESLLQAHFSLSNTPLSFPVVSKLSSQLTCLSHKLNVSQRMALQPLSPLLGRGAGPCPTNINTRGWHSLLISDYAYMSWPPLPSHCPTATQEKGIVPVRTSLLSSLSLFMSRI